MLQSEIEALVHRKSETAHLDYKAGFEWKKENKDHQLGLIRDMMGMANTQDGGTIIVGVKDETYDLVGVSPDILVSFDQTDIGQMLYSYSDPKLTFELQKAKVDGEDVIAIRVFEFNDVPIVCTDTVFGKDPTKPILRRSALYIRTPAAQTEEVSSAHDMRGLMGRGLQKRGDEVLRSVQNLIMGSPLVPTNETVNRYQEELAQADKWFREVLQKGFLNSARWELISYPLPYVADRVASLPALENALLNSQASLRVTPFPYIFHDSVSGMFNSGYQSFTDNSNVRVGFRLYRGGLFVLKHALWEDLQGAKTEEGKRTLSFNSAIYLLTEFLVFASRLYQEILVEDIHIMVRLVGGKDRALQSFEALAPLLPWYVSQEDDILVWKDLKLPVLRINALDIARNIAQQIFHVFNWTDVSDQVLAQWQNKILPLSR